MKSFWPHPMDLLGGVGQMEAHFGPLGDSVNLDARLVHSLRECAIGSEIVLSAPDGNPR
jgi:hypothetical protein